MSEREREREREKLERRRETRKRRAHINTYDVTAFIQTILFVVVYFQWSNISARFA